jgi:multidrug efflux pump subunit AcrB
MSGIVGDFLRIIPEVLIICFIASWFQGFFILPSNLSQFVTFEIKSAQKEFRGWFDVVRDYYGRILAYCLRRRYPIFFGLISIVAVTIVFALVTMEFVWTGKARAESFIINVYNPVNTNLAESDRVIKEVERRVLDLPPEEINSLVTNVGIVEEETGPQFGTYLGEVYVEFSELGYTERDTEKSMNELREKLALIPGPTSFSVWAYKGGPPTGKPVSVEIRGNDFTVLEKLAGEVVGELETMRGVKDIETNYRKGKDEIRIIVDEHKAKTLGLDVATMANEIRNAFSGGNAGNIRRGDEKIDIVVKYSEHFKNPDYLFGFSVPNAQGERIPVKSVAETRYGQGVFKIYHSERKRTITITADVARDETTSSTVNKALIKKFGTVSNVHPGYVYDYTGEFEDTQESLVSMIQAFWLAIGIIFIILTAVYRSFLQPLIIMTAIPFGFVGVFFGLFIMGEKLSLLAVIGGIVLMGAVVNNSGHLIDFINRAREDGEPLWDAVVDSGKIQLRPIILTSITMLASLFPLAFGVGGEEPYLAPMAISMFWGMLFSTMLTLFAVPCLYLIVEDIRDRLPAGLRGRR